ncbi:hypothetical protein B0H12DRAFT_1117172 [Mycena haematopus]|nr:hypothetical protein B0H12DRAFT_1117172 [Mycena haematopus]
MSSQHLLWLYALFCGLHRAFRLFMTGISVVDSDTGPHFLLILPFCAISTSELVLRKVLRTRQGFTSLA